jgi:hypothetical protein
MHSGRMCDNQMEVTVAWDMPVWAEVAQELGVTG